ncbi:MAG: hypothetical protein ACE5LV_06950 [Candidatus Aminicenantales bacterium]
MKLRTKALILLVAAILTFIGFSLMSSSSAVELVKMGKKAGYQIIANVIATQQSPAS